VDTASLGEDSFFLAVSQVSNSSQRRDLMRGWLLLLVRPSPCLVTAPERQNNYKAQRIRELMANHGWKYDRRRINKKWVRAFWNPCRPE